jgi:hypothetical protein
MGDKFDSYLKLKCHQASRGKLDLDLYNKLLYKSKARIQIAHAKAASKTIRLFLEEAIPQNRKAECITGRASVWSQEDFYDSPFDQDNYSQSYSVDDDFIASADSFSHSM